MIYVIVTIHLSGLSSSCKIKIQYFLSCMSVTVGKEPEGAYRYGHAKQIINLITVKMPFHLP